MGHASSFGVNGRADRAVVSSRKTTNVKLQRVLGELQQVDDD